MEENYEHLEGKIIDWKYPDIDRILKGKVIGIERSVGITIVEVDNETHNLTCVNGPMSKDWNIEYTHSYHENYDEYFDELVKMIESGFYDGKVSNEKFKEISGYSSLVNYTMSNCAFS